MAGPNKHTLAGLQAPGCLAAVRRQGPQAQHITWLPLCFTHVSALLLFASHITASHLHSLHGNMDGVVCADVAWSSAQVGCTCSWRLLFECSIGLCSPVCIVGPYSVTALSQLLSRARGLLQSPS